MKTFHKSIASFFLLLIILTLCPMISQAKWKDNSGSLPGLVSDSEVASRVGIALGAVAVGTLVYILIKRQKKLKASTPTSLFNDNLRKASFLSTAKRSLNANSSFLQVVETASRTMPVNLIVAPISNSNDLALGLNNTKGIQVGFRLKF